MFKNVYVPYKAYWSSPFCRWQGSFQNDSSIILGAATAKRFFETRDYSPDVLDGIILGMTIGQPDWFFGAPYFASLMGNDDLPGQTVFQACATSAMSLSYASMAVDTGNNQTMIVAATDKCSNGPQTIWPNPKGPGGAPIFESWMMDHFDDDPVDECSALQTAENVAKKHGITKEESDATALRRYEQYTDALANDREFQKRYMQPVEVRVSRKKTVMVVEDEGITPSTAEGLAKLRPTIPNGVVTFGAQTHPADGNAGMIVTTQEGAAELSADKNVTIQLLSYGSARAEKAHMAEAVPPSAENALKSAGIGISDLAAVKTHNPFTVNDVYMGRVMGIDEKIFNNYGSSNVFGHPQGPTGMRLIIELVEELVLKGGGYGLFAGCAAGDTGASIVVKVD
ncbi:MAG: thiolase family protein [Proteobacteria bacterium]|nr:thiolase family protein [Pseudomonadota bacterium]